MLIVPQLLPHQEVRMHKSGIDFPMPITQIDTVKLRRVCVFDPTLKYFEKTKKAFIVSDILSLYRENNDIRCYQETFY